MYLRARGGRVASSISTSSSLPTHFMQLGLVSVSSAAEQLSLRFLNSPVEEFMGLSDGGVGRAKDSFV